LALNQTQTQLLASVRKFSNTQGTTALLRHPDADVKDYINRALGALHRRLTSSVPDQRFLSSSTINIAEDDQLYDLPATFDTLISAELFKVTVAGVGSRVAAGPRYWLQAYEMHERPDLADTNSANATGMPLAYRLRGSTIEFLPIPDGDYDCLLWFVPNVSQLSSGSDTYDTISRLDEFIIAYATRPIAVKDKNWDLASACKGIIDELSSEIESIARNVDRNSPPRIVDVYSTDRWGRQQRRSR
jgi:hypothetical protein